MENPSLPTPCLKEPRFMSMRTKGIASFGALLVVALLASALRADNPFEVPITPGTGWPEFDPHGTLTFTLHDRVGGDTAVTGRYMTFEVEMGHLNPAGRGFPGSPASGSMPVEQHPIFARGRERHLHAACGESAKNGHMVLRPTISNSA